MEDLMYSMIVESDTVYSFDFIETHKGEKFYINSYGDAVKVTKDLKVFKKKENALQYTEGWKAPWWIKPIAFKIIKVKPVTKVIGYKVIESKNE